MFVFKIVLSRFKHMHVTGTWHSLSVHPNTMLTAYHIRGFLNICWKNGNIFGKGAAIFSEKEYVIGECDIQLPF